MSDLLKLEERVSFALRALYRRYGYAQFKMSKFEPYELYLRNKDFLVSDGIITFTDTDGTLMALKPDVTLSIVKNYRKEHAPLQKVHYSEHVYRIAGAGRTYREIMQTGLECLGDVDLYELCEVVMLAAKSLQTISDRFVLDLSHMGLLNRVLSELDLTDQQISQVMECVAEKNQDDLLKLLPAGRARKLLRLMQIDGPMVFALQQLEGLADPAHLRVLRTIAEYLAMDGTGLHEHVHLDFSMVSDRNYYNGIVFRGYVDGVPTAVLSGGQYDKLMTKMGKNAGGIGFAVYLDQLERLDPAHREFDVDTVLLYGPEDTPVEILKAAEELENDSIFVARSAPTRIRYRQLLKLVDGRLEKIENHG